MWLASYPEIQPANAEGGAIRTLYPPIPDLADTITRGLAALQWHYREHGLSIPDLVTVEQDDSMYFLESTTGRACVRIQKLA
jgi:hypothetical protein